MLDRARLLHAKGFATVMIDLQAHGESPGDSITVGHLEKHDVRAAVEYARRKHPTQPIGVIGVSLGGAAAVLASPLDIDALVIESVYPDIDAAIHNRVAARLGLLSAVPSELLLVQLQPRLGISRSELRPIDHIPNVGCPVLVASGTDDLHTTALETQAIFDAARDPKELWLVDGAAHVDLLKFGRAEYHNRIVGFLKRHLGSRTEFASQPETNDPLEIQAGR
jgi:alpha-beta hydrolase superfamily lysophospholipase